MDINILTDLISNVGFPIVACGAIFWKSNKDVERFEKMTSEMSDVVSNVSNALEENTKVLQDMISQVERRV